MSGSSRSGSRGRSQDTGWTCSTCGTFYAFDKMYLALWGFNVVRQTFPNTLKSS